MFSFAKQFEQDFVISLVKKIVSISLLFLTLTALLHLSIATHYCGGMKAASKISFSGKLATCGMENDKTVMPVTGFQLTTDCCDNAIVFLGINGNYFPSFSSVPVAYQNIIQLFIVPADMPFNGVAGANSISADISPPDVYSPYNVDLSDICILRI